MRSNALSPISQYRQHGVVLPIAMILLVVVSLLGVMAIRNATVADQTSNALRTNAVAQQAAEVALRYCEEVAVQMQDKDKNENLVVATRYSDNFTKVKKYDAGSELRVIANGAWNTLTNWAGEKKPFIEVPKDVYELRDAQQKVKTGSLTQAPRCIIEEYHYAPPLPDPLPANAPRGFLITARGFANDAVIDEKGKVSSGAEIWLQSVLTPRPAAATPPKP